MAGLELTTKRLVLVPFLHGDAVAVLSGARQSDWSAGYPTEGDLEIARMVATRQGEVDSPEEFGPYKVCERQSGLVIGGAGFLGAPGERGAVEIGYGIAPEWRNRGVATEAVGRLLAFAWSHPTVQRVVASAHPSNTASVRVLEKAGMSHLRTENELAHYEVTRPHVAKAAPSSRWTDLINAPDTTTDRDRRRASRPRHIGAIGTSARVVLGLIFLAFGLVGGKVIVSHGQLQTGFSLLSAALGLVVLPAALVGWHWLRGRHTPNRFEATGPLATTLNMLILFALVLTPWYAPPLAFTSGAALLFYGASLLLAARRGYAGCEVLAVSNWLLRRDDQVGCLVLSPIDHLERGLGR